MSAQVACIVTASRAPSVLFRYTLGERLMPDLKWRICVFD